MEKATTGRASTDALCKYRTCYSLMVNKGPFTLGKGYTSYHKNPDIVCRQNHICGCPEDPIIDIPLVLNELSEETEKLRWDKKKVKRLVDLLVSSVRSLEDVENGSD